MTNFTESLRPPYFAAVVAPKNGDFDTSGQFAMEEMISIAPRLDGFLGLETARLADGTGAAVCYWRSVEALNAWKSSVLTRLISELNLKHRRLEDACVINVTKVAKRLFSKKPPVLSGILDGAMKAEIGQGV